MSADANDLTALFATRMMILAGLDDATAHAENLPSNARAIAGKPEGTLSATAAGPWFDGK